MDAITSTINEVLLLRNVAGVSAVQLAAPVANRVLNAVNASCSCGGLPADNKDSCPACMVWHRLNSKA